MSLGWKSSLVALNTTTGNQTLTISDFGGITPVAAMFHIIGATTGAHVDDYSYSKGYFTSPDGTDRNYAMGVAGEHGDTNIDTDRIVSTNRCGFVWIPGGTATDIEITGLSFSNNAVVINVDKNDSATAVMCIVTLFGGTDIGSANVWNGIHDDLGTGTSPVDIKCGDDGTTQDNFQADLVFADCIANGTNPSSTTTGAAHAIMSSGVFARAEAKQMSTAAASANAVGTTDATTYMTNDKHFEQAHWYEVTWEATAAGDADGFTEDPSASAGSDVFIFLAFNFTTAPDIDIVESTLPGSAVDWTESVSFDPADWAMSQFSSGLTEGSLFDGRGIGCANAIVVYQDDTEVMSVGYSDEDAEAVAVCSQWAKSSFYIGESEQANGALVDASLDSMDPLTIDTGADTHDNRARKGFTLFIKAASAGHALLADDIESASSVDSPVIGQVHGLLANDVQSTSQVDSPAVGQIHALLVNDTESASEVSAPVLAEIDGSHDLLADDVESASNVDTPVVGQVHGLLANDVSSSTEVDSPVIGQTHGLLAASLESATEVSAPVVADIGTQALFAENIESQSTVSVVALNGFTRATNIGYFPRPVPMNASPELRAYIDDELANIARLLNSLNDTL